MQGNDEEDWKKKECLFAAWICRKGNHNTEKDRFTFDTGSKP